MTSVNAIPLKYASVCLAMMYICYKDGRDVAHCSWPADTIKQHVNEIGSKYDQVIVLEMDDYWAKFNQGIYQTGRK